MAFLEVACFNAESALIANKAGADRVELCASPEVGGTTPDYSTLREIRDQISVPIHVMIRPRGGNFVSTNTEIEQMKASIEQFRHIADGFAFGVLDANQKVDILRTKEPVHLAHLLPCTFHRAFDEMTDLCGALEDVVRCGINTILTAGGRSAATAGCHNPATLVKTARGRIKIMPGGGVRSTNIDELQRSTRATFFHSSAEIVRLKVSCQDNPKDGKVA